MLENYLWTIRASGLKYVLRYSTQGDSETVGGIQ